MIKKLIVKLWIRSHQ